MAGVAWVSPVVSASLPLLEIMKSFQLKNGGPTIDAGVYGVQEMETLVYLHFADARSDQTGGGRFCR